MTSVNWPSCWLLRAMWNLISTLFPNFKVLAQSLWWWTNAHIGPCKGVRYRPARWWVLNDPFLLLLLFISSGDPRILVLVLFPLRSISLVSALLRVSPSKTVYRWTSESLLARSSLFKSTFGGVSGATVFFRGSRAFYQNMSTLQTSSQTAAQNPLNECFWARCSQVLKEQVRICQIWPTATRLKLEDMARELSRHAHPDFGSASKLGYDIALTRLHPIISRFLA